MTKSLLVNCSLNNSTNEALYEAISKFSQCTIIQFREINNGYKIGHEIDAVIVSGSAARIVNPCHREMFKGVANLMRSCNLPLFSICYGHQLFCWAFGAKVSSLNQPVIGRFENVRIIKVDEIFADFAEQQTITLAESHYDYALRESLDQADLILLADSSSCGVEAVKHRHNPFYGVQFHPERTKIEGKLHLEGNRVIKNFYRNVVKQ
jgi:GMP synthase-like glutamine amidotransferase